MTGYFTRTYEHWREESSGTNAFGEPVLAWVLQATIEGRASPTTRTDTFAARATLGKVTWKFATTPDVDLQTGDEIRFDGRLLEVKSAAPTSTGNRVEATCEEILDA